MFFLCVQLFDALIVIVSFVLDIVFRNREDAASGVGLLVILRLWRVARILNGGWLLFLTSLFVLFGLCISVAVFVRDASSHQL